MSYRMRVALTICVLVACSAAVGALCLYVVNDVHHRHVASDELYGELRGLYEVGHRAEAAQLLLDEPGGNDAEVRRQLLIALKETDQVIARSTGENGNGEETLKERLGTMRTMLESAVVADRNAKGENTRASLNACLAQVATLAGNANRSIVENRQATTRWVERAEWSVGIVFAGTVILAGVLGIVLYRSIAKPMRDLKAGVERLAERRGDERIREGGPREFRDLIGRFNHMSERICTLERMQAQQVDARTEQLVRSEQLAGVGYLAAGMAHEINHPLGVIGGYAEMMLKRLSHEDLERAGADEMQNELKESFQTITEEVFRCHEMTTSLLQMTKPERERRETIDLGAMIERIGTMMRRLPVARDRQLAIEQSEIGPVMVRGSRAQLTQVFLNLMTNALEAVEAESGEVRVKVASQAGSALIRIEDNGCGMSQEALAHVFDPMFTGKQVRGAAGFGLGLSVSHTIVEQHGGRIDANSTGAGYGSTFVVELPAVTFVMGDMR